MKPQRHDRMNPAAGANLLAAVMVFALTANLVQAQTYPARALRRFRPAGRPTPLRARWHSR